MTETLGSWNNYRIELDATGPLTANGALRARADVVYATRDYFFDQAHLNRKKAFAVLEYDFTPTSTLTVGGELSMGRCATALQRHTGVFGRE
jgi:outer membrane receptor for ferric coprogen and ferric-rhodotorulic acid